MILQNTSCLKFLDRDFRREAAPCSSDLDAHALLARASRKRHVALSINFPFSSQGTVLIRSAEELENYSKTEEARMEEIIKSIADSGAQVIVSGASVGDMALHFCTRYGLMVTRLTSKFELRRFCQATGATALAKLQKPTLEELGFVKSIRVSEIGGSQVLLVEQDESIGQISTVVIRGSTENLMDDVERAVDDGVNVGSPAGG